MDYGTRLYLVVRGTLCRNHLCMPPYFRAFLSSVVVQSPDRALIKQSQHRAKRSISICYNELDPETPSKKATQGLIIQYQ